MTLRWEEQDGGALYAYSGEIVVAMVVKVSAGSQAGLWTWDVHLRLPHRMKSRGYCKARMHARRAVNSYWRRWLVIMGLEVAGASLAAPPAVAAGSAGPARTPDDRSKTGDS